jgi:TatD DNase family protein
MLIDTHCHLDIIEKEGLPIEDSLEKAKKIGVEKIVQIGIDRESSIRAKHISEKFNQYSISYTIGCHPADVISIEEQNLILQDIENNQSNQNFLGVGEIGLDYFHENVPRKEQILIFEKFLDIASRFKAPVVIHSRDAKDDTFDILSNFSNSFGVMHCYTYDYPMAKKLIDLGYYISFSGIVTFKSAKEIQEAASKLPLESILIETDAPFLAPPPYRGKRNEPSYLQYILDKIVELRNESKEDIQNRIFKNSENFIKKKGLRHA